MVYRWTTLCRSCNRNWGLNHLVLAKVCKTILLSILFYGCLIWMTDENMIDIDKLWYSITKSSVGAIFHVNRSILEVIVGIPPLQIQKKIISIKHYLKAITVDSGSDLMNPSVTAIIRDVYRFLIWKLSVMPNVFTQNDRNLITERNICKYTELSADACTYTKDIINKFTKSLWQVSLETDFTLWENAGLQQYHYSLFHFHLVQNENLRRSC